MCSASKKSTLDEKREGAPQRTKGQLEPHRAKVVRRMSGGFVPPGHNVWPRAQNTLRAEPQPLIVTVNNKVVYARGDEDPTEQATWRQYDVKEACNIQAKVVEERRREACDRIGIFRSADHYLPESSDGHSSGWIMVQEATTTDGEGAGAANSSSAALAAPRRTEMPTVGKERTRLKKPG